MKNLISTFIVLTLVMYSCEELPEMGVEGCMDENACNYDELATYDLQDPDSVEYSQFILYKSCTLPLPGKNCDGDKIGCIDIWACNFDPEAEADDGSCIYGCSDENACNYDETSTCDASCVFPPPGQDCDGLILGCTDDNYLEYYTQGFVADLDDGSCQTIAVFGCMDPAFCTFNPQANLDDGSCNGIPGCTDPTACNFDSNANCDDGSCSGLLGCTDPIAENYNPQATCDDGSCVIYVQSYLDNGITPQQIISQGGYPLDSLYGKNYQGGWIFHYNISMNKGLIASYATTPTFDQTSFPNWYCRAGGEGMYLGTSEAVYTGQGNTSIWNSLVSGGDWPSNGWQFGTSSNYYYKYTSKVLAHNQHLTTSGIQGGNYSDWYVPSIDEIFAMYTNLILPGYVAAPTWSFISSSENPLNTDLVQVMTLTGSLAGQYGYTVWKNNINPGYVYELWPIRTF